MRKTEIPLLRGERNMMMEPKKKKGGTRHRNEKGGVPGLLRKETTEGGSSLREISLVTVVRVERIRRTLLFGWGESLRMKKSRA